MGIRASEKFMRVWFVLDLVAHHVLELGAEGGELRCQLHLHSQTVDIHIKIII